MESHEAGAHKIGLTAGETARIGRSCCGPTSQCCGDSEQTDREARLHPVPASSRGHPKGETMTVTDERVFFPEKMSERVSPETLALFSDPQWIGEGCTAQMHVAHLMAVELTERRARDAPITELTGLRERLEFIANNTTTTIPEEIEAVCDLAATAVKELAERRERERWMEDELVSIAETVQPVDDEDTGLRSYMVINIRRIIEVDQEKWLELMQRVRDRKPLPEPPDA